MKKFLFLTALLFSMVAVNAQYYYVPHLYNPGNPGGLNNDWEYAFGGTLAPEGWTIIHEGSASTPQWTAIQTIPFSFNFNNTPVTQFKVSTSGILTFSTAAATAPAYAHSTLPSASIPDNSVCIWGLAGLGTNDKIATKVFGEAPNRQFWVLFSSYNVFPATEGWTYWSIVFEETTNDIFLVNANTQEDLAIAVTPGIQINSTTAIQVDGSPNVPNNSGSNNTAVDNVFYQFVYGDQQEYDLGAVAITNEYFIPLAGANINVTGLLVNFGTETITSLDMNYQIDEQTVVTQNITGLNIGMFELYNFTHPTAWSPTEAGGYNVKVWASNLNGNPDQNPINDEEERSISIVNSSTPQKPMHEVFTSSTCGPCVPGNQNLSEIFGENEGEFVCVKYQMNWPGNGDPYYTEEGGFRRGYYGVNAVPDMYVNGTNNVFPPNYTQGEFDDYSQKVTYADISVEMEVVGTQVTVNAIISPLADYPFNFMTAHVIIIENMTTENATTNGETEFHFVMMKMLPDEKGMHVNPLTMGNNMNINVSADLSGTNVEEYSDLSAVVFLQNDLTGEVYQAAWTYEFTPPAPTVTFNPANGATNVPANTNIVLNFNEPIRNLDNSAITNPTGLIDLKLNNQNGTDVDYTATINSAKTAITITPAENLTYEQVYYIGLDAVVENNSDVAIVPVSSTFTVQADPNIGIAEMEKMYELEVYPNPTNANLFVTLTLKESSFVKIEVFDILGKRVETTVENVLHIGNQSVMINTANFSEGFYMVSVTIGGETATKKIFVQR